MKASATPSQSSKMTPSWSLLKPSALLVREHYEAVIYLYLIPALLYVLGTLLVGPITTTDDLRNLTQNQIIGVVLSIVGLLYTVVSIGPSTYFQLRAVSHPPQPVLEYYRKGLRFSLRLISYYIVFGIITAIGLVLLIVPGIIIIRRYILAGYYLVEDDISITEAMRRSKATSTPYGGYILGIVGVQFALSIAAAAIGNVSPLGIVGEQIITCLAVFLLVLRYREIQAATPKLQ